MAANVQTLRFRRPTNNQAPKTTTTRTTHHTGILQDQIRRHERRPWTPSFSMAVRLLLLMRVASAMYSDIADCDEVFNFWEPLHYLDRGQGFQTWETSPVYAIRSYAYILFHWPAVRLARVIGSEKRPAFFAVRIFLAAVCSLCEARFYRAVVEKINLRVGRYLFFMLIFNAGMWNASTALIPSSFAMYANTLAFSYAIEPAGKTKMQRTVLATLSFAAGAIVGWPFALAMAIPFIMEELFIRGTDHVAPSEYAGFVIQRVTRLITAGATAALLLVPVVALDSLFYGRLTVTPWNIVSYNLFSDPSRGPELYGTEPWYYFFLNMALNFNILLPMALLSLPALAVTHVVDRKRLGHAGAKDQSSPYTVLALRLAPMYVWWAVLTLSKHKEERFMFPAYTMVCFNAAVALYLVRGWVEVAYVKATSSTYKASRTPIFRTFTSSVVIYTTFVSFSRIVALRNNYHAPSAVLYHLETAELPRALNATGLITLPTVGPAPGTYEYSRENIDRKHSQVRIDMSPLRELDLRLCIGKEWHRFPGSYLVPDGVDIRFVKSAFDGLVPGRFPEVMGNTVLDRSMGTRIVPMGMNDLNQEQMAHYVDIQTCDYLIDLDFPHHPIESALEPRYAIDSANWERVVCKPFLDARHSPLLSRILWLPGRKWASLNEYGDYCLLRSTKLADGKVRKVAERVAQGQSL